MHLRAGFIHPHTLVTLTISESLEAGNTCLVISFSLGLSMHHALSLFEKCVVFLAMFGSDNCSRTQVDASSNYLMSALDISR